MEKRSYAPVSYNYLDSQRLKDTFFSDPQKKVFSKKFIGLSLSLFLSFTLLLIIVLNYDFIIISRQKIKLQNDSKSLIREKMISSFKLLNEDERLMKIKKNTVYLALPAQKEIKLNMNFDNPINLYNNYLILYLKKSTCPLKLSLVIKDTRFYSNSLTPLTINTKDHPHQSYLVVPIDFKDSPVQNANLSQTKQITVSFFSPDKNNLSAANFKNNWIFIKDLIIVKEKIYDIL